MPLDHFVSQVHLKNFNSPELGGEMLHAIRKSDLKSFNTNSKSVCRIENGSTNTYLQDERVIEEFLKGIEPKYNEALKKLKNGNIDKECIYAIAGFVAYILTCSPAGMRIQSVPLRNVVEENSRILESKGLISAPPPELGSENLINLLNGGKVKVEIDPKYPQAIGIVSILDFIIMFGNFSWDILINSIDDSPFFTSDFPVAIEKTEDLHIINRVIPLSPDLAIRIHPNPSFDKAHSNFSFSNFHYRIKKLNRSEVININKLIVCCGEEYVFFRNNYEWIPKFVKKNAAFRIETKNQKIHNQSGTFLWNIQEITEVRRS